MSAEALPAPGDAARQRWLLAGLFALFAVVNFQYVCKIADPERTTRSAFLRWSGQLRALETGEDIWATYAYPNPPIMALILWPFTQPPPVAGAVAWFYCKVALAVLAVGWTLRWFDAAGRPFPWWGKGMALLLSLRPIAGDLVHGNVNLFILFLIVAALSAYRRRHDVGAGLLLGLAVACKVTPALFIPYFLWKRAWKTLAGTAVGLLLFVWVVPGAILGWGSNQTYLASWYHAMVHPYTVEGKVTTEHQNQSLPGLLHRLLTDSASFSEYDYEAGGYVPTEQHNLAAWDPAVMPWLVKGAMAAFAALVVWRCRTATDARADWRLTAEFSVVIVGMLLFSERTWKHHCVVLLLPFAVLAYVVSARAVPRRARWIAGGALALAFLLMTLTSTGLFDRHDRLGKMAQVYGAYVGAFFTLLAGLLAVLGRKQTPAAEGEASACVTLRRVALDEDKSFSCRVGRAAGEPAG